MRKCDNCGNDIPLGSNHIEVRIYGFKVKGGDFCKPTCFEKFYENKRYVLWREELKQNDKR